MRLRRTELVLPWVLPKPPPTAGKAEMETISLSQVNQSQHLFEQRWRPTGIRWPRFWPQARQEWPLGLDPGARVRRAP